MNNIIEVILDVLNEDHDLCFELGEKPQQPDLEEDAD
jgi:hypothetical protein